MGTNKNYFWKYQPIGQRRFINGNGDIVQNVTSEIDTQRIRDIEDKTLLKFSEFRKAHCSACPDEDGGSCSGGYFLAIAPEICSNNISNSKDNEEDGDDDDDDDDIVS